ncbi:hypothetical protein HDU98_006604 [Podochytrium sp. JEL0797]|nr:hypothetical protein HDU98_006604 [Podochytrium sp. JEL0797]
MVLPKLYYPYSACLAALLRSLCGVTGGATKAALSQHFAICDNMADLHAKEGSQETVVGLVGMLLGSLIMQLVSDDSVGLTWACFALFTALHLICNYCGISAVIMPSLNTQRAFLVIRQFLNDEADSEDASTSRSVLTPEKVARLETIFWSQNYFNGHLWSNDRKTEGVVAPIRMGVSLDRVLDAWSGGVGEQGGDWESLLVTFKTDPLHFLAIDSVTNRISVAIRNEASPSCILGAYFHALILQRNLLTVGRAHLKEVAGRRLIVKESVKEFERMWPDFLSAVTSEVSI